MYKVLVVEDDPDFLEHEIGMKAWSECGFIVAETADYGRPALKLMEKETFDLVVTDIRMPMVDGVELLKAIRAKGDNTTIVVFMSSYTDFTYAKEGIKNGLYDYIEKPVNESKLRELLTRVKSELDARKRSKIDDVMSGLLEELHLSAEKDPFVYTIALYCAENYGGGLSGDELSYLMGLNTDYFGKQFKQHFGITHKEFKKRVKIAYAIALLHDGTHRVYEISEMLGYPSYKQFAEKFKEVTGVAPSEYKF